MIKEILLVGAGGFLGSTMRYLTSVAANLVHPNHSLPISTFTVNIVGSLLIGMLIAAVRQESWYFFAVVGFCGGFTTFSAFSAELFNMIQERQYLLSLGYALLSVVLCLAAVWVGVMIITKFVK